MLAGNAHIALAAIGVPFLPHLGFGEVFATAATKGIMLFQAMMAYGPAIACFCDIAIVVIVSAFRTTTVIFVTARTAHIPLLIVLAINAKQLAAILIAVVAFLILIGTAIPAVKIMGDFPATADAKPVSAYAKGPAAFPAVLADTEFGIKFLVIPVAVAAKAGSCIDDEFPVVVVTEGLPKVRGILQE